MNKYKKIFFFFILILLFTACISPVFKSYSNQTKYSDEIQLLISRNGSDHCSLQSSQKIIDIIETINYSLIQKYLNKITTDFKGRVTGSTVCSNAGEWIYNELLSMQNLTVRKQYWSDRGNFLHWFKAYEGFNVEAELTGLSNESTVFILSAQYDVTSSESPGALDNGAGIATLLAIAKVLNEYSFCNTLRFLCFSGEEQGLLGSYAYAQEAYDRNEQIVAVLNADVIGNNTYDCDDNQLLRGFSTEAAKWIISVMNQTCYQYDINLSVEHRNYKGHSDDKAFDDYGFPAMQLFQSGNNMESYYGSTKDTISLINQSYLRTVTTCIAASLAVLGDYHVSPLLSIEFPKENTLHFGSSNSPLFSHGNTVVIGKQPVQIKIQSKSDDLDYVHFTLVEKDNEMKKTNEIREIVAEERCFQPPYEWIIEGIYFGWYTLRVTAVNENGSSFTDEMEIFKIF